MVKAVRLASVAMACTTTGTTGSMLRAVKREKRLEPVMVQTWGGGGELSELMHAVGVEEEEGGVQTTKGMHVHVSRLGGGAS